MPPEGEGNPLVGWLLVGTGAFDFLLAAFFYFVRRPADDRARVFLPLAMIIAGGVIGGLGVLVLKGIIHIG